MELLLILFVVYFGVFMLHPRFGHLPSGNHLKRIKQSTNYSKGQFQNQSPTPSFTEGANVWRVMIAFFFKKPKRTKPAGPLPSQKANLKNLSPEEDVLVWFGHSSYFIQADGKTILVDPVFSGHASPIKFTTKAFKGTDIYTTDDLPEIDYLFITHDHWDHLDYRTVIQLKGKVKKIITGLGTGSHLEYWGFEPAIITECDWNESIDLTGGFMVHAAPARHFSGRAFSRNRTLWTSFVLKTPTLSLYLGGDSGYDSHFKQIGEKFGPFDLAMLECGQYNDYWKYIHMMPEQVVTAAKDLKADKLMPVHWGKFSLALHDWDEPIIRVAKAAHEQGMPIVTPLIGQIVHPKLNEQFTEWWRDIE